MKKTSSYVWAAVVTLVVGGVFSFPYAKNAYTYYKQEQVRKAVEADNAVAEAADDEVIKEGQAKVYSNFYYQQLTRKEKADYIRLVDALQHYETTPPFTTQNQTSLKRIYLAVSYDYPEFYWLSEVKEFDFSALSYPKDVKATYAAIQAAADQIIAQMPEGSDYDKVKYIYQTIIEQTQYDVPALTNDDLAWQDQSPRSVFLNHLSVCAGYSRSFQLLCQKAGIPCLYVVGDISVYNQTHAWNLVRIDGNYYPVDATWGDPTFDQQVAGQENSTINYSYLCTPKHLFNETHQAWTGFFEIDGGDLHYPALAENALNYYALNGAYFEAFDRAQLLTFVQNKGAVEMSFQMGSKEAYLAVMADLQSENSLVHEALRTVPGYTGYRSLGDDHTYQITLQMLS